MKPTTSKISIRVSQPPRNKILLSKLLTRARRRKLYLRVQVKKRKRKKMKIKKNTIKMRWPYSSV
jgi:hypothetical protein